MPQFYPIFLNLTGKNCLVIGGGQVAARKVQSLLDCGAQVEVISPALTDSLQTMQTHGAFIWTKREFLPGDEKGRFLLFAATGDRALNRQVAELCWKEPCFFNAVDDPEACDFYVPAVIRQGSVAAAVSTTGASPLFAAFLRDEMTGIISEEAGKMAAILESTRERTRKAKVPYATKKKMYQEILAMNWRELLQEGKEEEVRENVEQCISSWLG